MSALRGSGMAHSYGAAQHKHIRYLRREYFLINIVEETTESKINRLDNLRIYNYDI